jgi:DegV family protein with EDD domain
MSPLPVEVLESRATGEALGLIVLAAARAAKAGKSLAEVAQTAKDMMPRVNLLITLETLYYVARGGRIGKAQAWAGGLLNMKPILEVPVSQGIVCPVQRVRTKSKAMEKMIEIMAQRVGDAKPVHVIVHCADNVSEAKN